MEELKTMVNALDEMNEREQIVKQLQEIGKVLLTEYKIKIGDNIIQPLLVEAYYYEAGKFEDECCHAVATKSGAIKKLASERQQKFNEIYVHLNKKDGIDLCLGKPGRYLAFLIKNALVNGEFATQCKVSDMICSRCEGCVNGENCKYYGAKVLKLIKKPEANQDERWTLLAAKRKGTNQGKYADDKLAFILLEKIQGYPYTLEKDYGKTALLNEYLSTIKKEELKEADKVKIYEVCTNLINRKKVSEMIE